MNTTYQYTLNVVHDCLNINTTYQYTLNYEHNLSTQTINDSNMLA